MEVRERIRDVRLKRKISQTKVAEAIGKTLRMYQMYEDASDKGITPSVYILDDIARVLDVDAGYLLTGNEYLSTQYETIKNEAAQVGSEPSKRLSDLAVSCGFKDLDSALEMLLQFYELLGKYHITQSEFIEYILSIPHEEIWKMTNVINSFEIFERKYNFLSNTDDE